MPLTDADPDIADDDQLELFPPPPPPARAGVPRGAVVVLSIAAAVLLLACVGLLVLLVRERSSTDSSTDRTEISTTAARMAEAMTAVDEAGNGTMAATVDQLGTAPVVDQYKGISGTIRGELATFKLKSIRGTVKDVYVGNIDNAESRVIVRLDLVFVGDNTRVVPDQYLDMTLAKLDGQWKVDNVQVLNVQLANPAPSSSSSPPATSPSVPSTSSGG
ncbi:MAG TPA: hypothetical protein VFV00_09965 [Acidimicrobiales bacterium]|nr:hypothetical protein [Acidimicrobiales bacterium]